MDETPTLCQKQLNKTADEQFSRISGLDLCAAGLSENEKSSLSLCQNSERFEDTKKRLNKKTAQGVRDGKIKCVAHKAK